MGVTMIQRDNIYSWDDDNGIIVGIYIYISGI